MRKCAFYYLLKQNTKLSEQMIDSFNCSNELLFVRTTCERRCCLSSIKFRSCVF